ncbi:cellulase family glycosylhydrolase [Paraburkholderia hayleyella]|uniref:cellulase family glycosylhydrolase n=1 Tax=Paraburkholderia hayleyella TaxID=2152889 RepID=UPI001580B0C3|nr:cellulase family glycosylhydrolase [Paraburkholderia hayleyella]
MRAFVRYVAGAWFAVSGLFAACSVCLAATPIDRVQKIGVQVNIDTFTASDAFRIKRTGFDFVRFGVWEHALNKVEYRQEITEAFAYARAVGLPVLVTVRSINALVPETASGAQQEEMLQAAGFKLASIAGDLAHAFGHDLLAIELWNEPDVAAYWPTGNVTQTFQPYMRAVCAALQAQSLRVPVIGFAFSRPPDLGATAATLSQQMAPLTNCLNGFSYHAYSMTQEQVKASNVNIQSRYRLPALITEWGWSSDVANDPWQQAQEVGNFLDWIRTTGTPVVSLYTWKDSTTGSLRERNFGLVTAQGAAKPALNVVANALRYRYYRNPMMPIDNSRTKMAPRD